MPPKPTSPTPSAGEARIEYMSLTEIQRANRNPKRHADATIQASIRRFGFVAPLVLDDRTKRLVAGHGRLDALVALRDAGRATPKRILQRSPGTDWLVPVLRGVEFKDEREAEAYLLADNRWEITHDTASVNRVHPTQKPVEIFAIPMRNHTKAGELVYEPFSGSGSQIIAAEKERRRCNALDLKPGYVDVAVLRWQRFSAKEATLAGDGRTFAEIAAERVPPPAEATAAS